VHSQFIIGFIAGEGSFSAKVYPRDSQRFGVQVVPEFSLKVKEKEVIHNIVEYTEIGYVRDTPDGYAAWRISSNEELQQLISFIEGNRRGGFECCEKYNAYNRWKKVVEGRRELMMTEEGMKELVERAREINQMGARPPARSKEELFNIIESNGSYECGHPLDDGNCERTVSNPDSKCYLHDESS